MLPDKPKSKRGSMSSEAGESSELDAARDVLSAIKSGDAEALSLALTRHREACESDSDEDDAEEV